MPSRETPGTKLAALERKVKRLSMVDGLQHSTITNGNIKEVDDEGRVVAIIGKQPDGSHAIVPLDGPTPLQATTPVCKGGAFAIEVTWDGNLVGPDGVIDAELDAYEDTEGAAIYVGDAIDFEPSAATLRGLLPGRLGGTVAVAAGAGQKFVRIAIRSKVGKLGPPSEAVAVTVSPIVPIDQFDEALERLRGENIEGLSVENLVVTDQANINELVVQALAARTAEFIEVAANQITAGVIQAALKIYSEGSLQLGLDTGRHVYGDGSVGLEYRQPGESDDGTPGDPVTITRMGEEYSVLDADGATVASLTAAGVSAPVGDFEQLLVAGEDVVATMNNRPGDLIFHDSYAPVIGPFSAKTGAVEIVFPVQAGRWYEIHVEFGASADGGTFGAGLTAKFTDAPTINSTPLGVGEWRFPGGGGSRVHRSFTTQWKSGKTDPLRVLLWLSGNVASSQDHWFTVREYGYVDPGDGIRVSLGGATGAPPPDPVEAKSWKTYYCDPVWTECYNQYGPASHGFIGSKLRQGANAQVSNPYGWALRLPSADLSRIAGVAAGDIGYMYLGLLHNGPTSGGTAAVGLHAAGNVSAPSSMPTIIGTRVPRAYSGKTGKKNVHMRVSDYGLWTNGTVRGLTGGSVNSRDDLMDFADNPRFYYKLYH